MTFLGIDFSGRDANLWDVAYSLLAPSLVLELCQVVPSFGWGHAEEKGYFSTFNEPVLIIGNSYGN